MAQVLENINFKPFCPAALANSLARYFGPALLFLFGGIPAETVLASHSLEKSQAQNAHFGRLSYNKIHRIRPGNSNSKYDGQRRFARWAVQLPYQGDAHTSPANSFDHACPGRALAVKQFY